MTNLPLGYDINFKTIDQQYGPATIKRPDRTEDIIAVTGKDQTTEEAKAKVNEVSSNAIYEAFIRGYQTNMSADELSAKANDLGIKQNDFNSNQDFITEQALTVNNSDWSSVDTRLATNYQIANEIITERMQAIGEDKTTFGRGVDVVDRFLRSASPIGTYEGLTAATEAKSMDVLTKAATMSPTEFRAWFETMADSTAQEGIFRGNNLGAFEDLRAAVDGAGYDPMKGFNQIMGVFDVATSGSLAALAKGAKAAVKTTIKSTTKIGRVAAIEGVESANKAAESILKNTPDPEVLGNIGPEVLDLNPQPVRGAIGGFTKKFEQSKIAKDIEDIRLKGGFGRVADKASIKKEAETIAERQSAKVSSPVFDIQPLKIVDEALGSAIAKVRFGRPDTGAVFKPLADGTPPESLKRFVEEVRQKVERAEIVPVDVNDASKGYVVEVSERINLSGLPDAVNEALGIQPTLVRETIGKVMNNSIMGSAALRDSQRLSTLSQMAESSRAAVKQVVKPYTEKIGKLGAQERYTVQAVYTQLRDGVDASSRVRYTDAEFAIKYKEFHPRGEGPSQKAIDAFHALADVEEADYLLKSHSMLNHYIEKGYQDTIRVADGYYAPAKKVPLSSVSKEAKVLDGATGAKLRIQDFESEELPVWKLDKPTPDGQEYVVGPTEVRLIDPTDVMGYNPGGSRLNPNAKYFVVIGDKRIKAMLTTFSEKQAKLASQQLRNIQDAIKAGSLTDDIIRANNDWHRGIESVADFEKLAKEEGWDFTRGEITYKNRDGDLLEQDVNASDLFSGMKADDYIQNDLRRNDKVLLDFGGGRAYNADPVNAVLSQFGNSVFTYTNRAYTRNAMVGWVKRAQEKGRDWFPAGVSTNDYEALFRGAKITGKDEFAIRMKELRNITMRRLGMKDEYAKYIEDHGSKFAEYVFDKTGLKFDGNPVNGMLKIGFQSAFGFMNVSQFFMQAFHSVSVMTISPVHGVKGAALTIPLRSALKGYSEGFSDLVVQRWAKAAGVSKAEAREWLEFIRTSGRNVVDGDAIEDGTGIGFGISGWRGESMKYTNLSGAAYNVSKAIGKGLDLGLMPFKQGERLGRMTAMNTAILEFKAKFPGVSVLSDQARMWITRREQDLTFNMSSLSRGAIQNGPGGLLKVPTQWLAYSMRAMEEVVVGRNFTAAERARLAAGLMPMFGLAGFGLENSADYIAEKLGIEPSSSLYVTLKYGIIDGLIDALPGDVEVGVGKRLAPIGAFIDTYKNITEGQFAEVVGGPSGQIAKGLYDAFANTATSLFHGHSATLTEDVVQLLRTPSGLDNIAKAYGIFNNGIYRSKTGVSLPYEMSIGDGITALTGFTPLEVVENYTRMDQMYTSEKKFSSFRKEVNRDAEVIFTLMEGDIDNVEKAIKLMQELHERISFSGFSQTQQMELRRATMHKLETNWVKIQDNLIKTDRLYALQAAQSILKGTE